jgi:class 3 adenylate cyclase
MATPAMAAEIMRHNLQMDVRALLPHIRVPTLVIHAARDPMIPAACGRYLANHLPNCQRYVEIEADFHASWLESDHDLVMDPVEEFIAGQITSTAASDERFLTTVLFTDIVASTRHLLRVGDSQWREILDAHDVAVSEEIARLHGRLVDRTGDGVLACFDGPARAIQCCRRIMSRARALGLSLRAGVEIGECEVRGDRLAGLTVHRAARVMALAGPGEILTTRMVRGLSVGSGLNFRNRGDHCLKGFDDVTQVFSVDV